MRQKTLFMVSAGCYLLSSASVLPMGAGDISGQNGSAAVAIVLAVLFWLALLAGIAVQLILRRLLKPYRQKQSWWEQLLSPPTIFFGAGFLLAGVEVIVLTVLKMNGFVVFLFLFFMLACLELTLLTMGKFRQQDGKIVFLMDCVDVRSNEEIKE